MFNVKEVTEGVINWIREWCEENGKTVIHMKRTQGVCSSKIKKEKLH